MASEIIAAGKKLDHIFLVKRLIAGLGKVSRDACKVEVNSVALGDGIDAVEVSDPLILDQGGDRTLRNRQDILADGLPFRIDLAVSDNEQARLRGRSSGFLIAGNKREYRWSDKDLPGDATIDMELVVILSAHPHLNSDRRENPGKCRRGEQYLAEQGLRFAIVAHRDPPHVPQYRPLRIKIGGTDQQDSAFHALSGYFLQKRIVDVFRNQPGQRRVVGQRGSFKQARYVVGKNVLSAVFGKNLAQLIVMFASEECERRNERAGADTGDQIEGWPRAGIAPAGQQPGAEGTVFGTAGYRQKIRDRRMPCNCRRQLHFRFRRICHHDGLDFTGRGVTPKAYVMKSSELGLAGYRLRQYIARGNRCTSGGQSHCRTDQGDAKCRLQQAAKAPALHKVQTRHF